MLNRIKDKILNMDRKTLITILVMLAIVSGILK